MSNKVPKWERCLHEHCRFWNPVGHRKCGLMFCVGIPSKTTSVDVECGRCGETYTVEPFNPPHEYTCICGMETILEVNDE